MNQSSKRLCIISGASPNTHDAVGDFAWLLAKELSSSFKTTFIVPETYREKSNVIIEGIQLHRVAKGWGQETLKEIQNLVKAIQPDAILVHFVPQLYGWNGAKPYFALLLKTLKKQGFPIVTVAHEFSSPFSTSPKLMVLAAAHRILFRAVVKASKSVVFTNTLYHELVKRKFKNRSQDFQCIPVGCPTPVLAFDEASKQKLRNQLGLNNGELLVTTFGSSLNSVAEQLKKLFTYLVEGIGDVRFLLIGKSGKDLMERLATDPAIKNRLLITGSLTGEEISGYLAISDLYAVFYPDGASSRRTSFLLGLAHALPMVSNKGILTDSIIESSMAIYLIHSKLLDKDLEAVRNLLRNSELKKELGSQARRLFEEHFSWNIIGLKYKRLIESVVKDG